MDLRFADWAENSRIKTIATIITGDKIHPIGQYNLFKVTPVMTRHRRLCIFDFLTSPGGHKNVAGTIAHYVARYGNDLAIADEVIE